MEGFPKYQYSVFLKNGRDQQLVIRANTFEELVEAKKNVDKILEVSEKNTETLAKEFVANTPEVAPSEHFCALHSKEMKIRSNPRDPKLTWYDHRQKDGEQWQQCSGNGWKNS